MQRNKGYYNENKYLSIQKKKQKGERVNKRVYQLSHFSEYEIDLIKYLQFHWRKYFQTILVKIIFIQKYIKGWFTRKILLEIANVNSKIEKMIIKIQIVILYHSIKFNYRKAYKKTKKKYKIISKKFLKLQRNIHHFLIRKKISDLLKYSDLNRRYIIFQKVKSLIKKDYSTNSFIIKKIFPISKILSIQRAFRCFYKNKKVFPLIKKIHFLSKYFFNKVIKKHQIRKKVRTHLIFNQSHETELFLPTIKSEQNFFTKKLIKISLLTFIQKTYKRYYKYEVSKKKILKTKRKIQKPINHHMITKIFKVDKIKKILLIQRNTIYFLYRLRVSLNAINKQFLFPCIHSKKTYLKYDDHLSSKQAKILIIMVFCVIIKIKKRKFLNRIKPQVTFTKKLIFDDIDYIETIVGEDFENRLENRNIYTIGNKKQDWKRKSENIKAKKNIKKFSIISLENKDKKRHSSTNEKSLLFKGAKSLFHKKNDEKNKKIRKKVKHVTFSYIEK